MKTMNQQTFIKKLSNTNTSNKPSPVSGSTLQLIIGSLGIALPIVLIIGAKIFGDCEFVQNSISAYYHTVMNDVFVGALCAVAIGLFAYYGYSSLDNIIANLAGIFTLGVAFFPTSVGKPFTDCLTSTIDMGMFGTIHYISATFLFITFAIFSLFLFTKSGEEITINKKKRNVIYKICGYLIFIFIALIAVYSCLLKGEYHVIDKSRPVFWLETLSLFAFSISWLVKSGLILKDIQPNEATTI